MIMVAQERWEKFLMKSYIDTARCILYQVAGIVRENYAGSIAENAVALTVPQFRFLLSGGLEIMEIARRPEKHGMRKFPQELHGEIGLQLGVFALVILIGSVDISDTPEFQREMAEIRIVYHSDLIFGEEVFASDTHTVKTGDRHLSVKRNIAAGRERIAA